MEVVAPARLGPGFRWLLAATWTSNLGDGVVRAAGPLLVASQTDDAFLVALAALLQWLPPLLFGLVAGAVTDRVDRRWLVAGVNAVRCAVLGVLAATILTDVVSIWLVLVTMFVLGTVEIFSDNAVGTLLPDLVDRDDLAVGNARQMVGFITLQNLVGPPVGAFLFAAGMASPFVAQAVLVSLAGLLVSRIVLPPRDHGDDRHLSTIGRDIREGFRWVAGHAAVRTLILTVTLLNLTFGASWSILVLYATEHLGMGAVGFGLITTTMAAGGILATLCYGWLTKRISLGGLMRIGLVIETFTHLGLALATTPYVALPIFFLFGAHEFVWATTSVTIRQRAVPSGLQGRVNAVNMMGVCGGLVIGAALGGLIAREWGVTGPLWFAFFGAALTVALLWRSVSHIAHDTDHPEPGAVREEPSVAG